MQIKSEYKDCLSYEYLKHTIQTRLFEEGFGFNVKCSMDKVLKLNIPIPMNSKKQFSLDAQKEISGIYSKIAIIKHSILEELNKVSDAEINLE